MTEVQLIECRDCSAARVTAPGGKPKTVPGTGVLDCPHLVTDGPTAVDVVQVVHVALSTLLRTGDLSAEGRVFAHQVQEWMRASDRQRRTTGLPYALVDGYGVSSAGLAVARVSAAAMAALVPASEAFYWKAAASVMRRKLG
jgi:hypothetical protein